MLIVKVAQNDPLDYPGQKIDKVDIKITLTTRPTTPPHHPPCSGKKVLTVKVAQNDPLDSSSQKIDQVDSKIKDVG